MKLQPGDQLGAYEIVSEVGQGGMASVYKAYHDRLDRYVAVKLMHEAFLQDEDFRARFQREARIVARLEHPNIVPVYDYNEHADVPYLVMKYIEGMTLKRKAIKIGLSLFQIRDYLMAIADGIDYAHTQGILHRDLKPSNIVIDANDTPYIMDFGLARLTELGASTISRDMMLGTPFYISPEQAQGETDIDSRADIYSLGVILYEMVTGRVPFEGDTPYAIVHGHIHKAPTLPTEIEPDLPDEIDSLIDKALAKHPADRYPTARALIEDFSEILAGKAPKRRPQPKPRYQEPVDKEPANNIPSFLTGASKNHDPDLEIKFGDLDFSQIKERFRSGVASLAEMIEERIDTELRQRRGVALTEEEMIRRRVAKRMKARQDFIKNLTSYLSVNGFLIALWFFSGSGFFWPFFPLFFWGMGLLKQGGEYYAKYGPGAERMESRFEEEVRREMERVGPTIIDKENRKKKKTDRLGLSDVQTAAGAVRLNEDGEFTDSFIEDQNQQRRQQR